MITRFGGHSPLGALCDPRTSLVEGFEPPPRVLDLKSHMDFEKTPIRREISEQLMSGASGRIVTDDTPTYGRPPLPGSGRLLDC